MKPLSLGEIFDRIEKKHSKSVEKKLRESFEKKLQKPAYYGFKKSDFTGISGLSQEEEALRQAILAIFAPPPGFHFTSKEELIDFMNEETWTTPKRVNIQSNMFLAVENPLSDKTVYGREKCCQDFFTMLWDRKKNIEAEKIEVNCHDKAKNPIDLANFPPGGGKTTLINFLIQKVLDSGDDWIKTLLPLAITFNSETSDPETYTTHGACLRVLSRFYFANVAGFKELVQRMADYHLNPSVVIDAILMEAKTKYNKEGIILFIDEIAKIDEDTRKMVISSFGTCLSDSLVKFNMLITSLEPSIGFTAASASSRPLRWLNMPLLSNEECLKILKHNGVENPTMPMEYALRDTNGHPRSVVACCLACNEEGARDMSRTQLIDSTIEKYAKLGRIVCPPRDLVKAALIGNLRSITEIIEGKNLAHWISCGALIANTLVGDYIVPILSLLFLWGFTKSSDTDPLQKALREFFQTKTMGSKDYEHFHHTWEIVMRIIYEENATPITFQRLYHLDTAPDITFSAVSKRRTEVMNLLDGIPILESTAEEIDQNLLEKLFLVSTNDTEKAVESMTFEKLPGGFAAIYYQLKHKIERTKTPLSYSTIKEAYKTVFHKQKWREQLQVTQIIIVIGTLQVVSEPVRLECQKLKNLLILEEEHLRKAYTPSLLPLTRPNEVHARDDQMGEKDGKKEQIDILVDKKNKPKGVVKKNQTKDKKRKNTEQKQHNCGCTKSNCLDKRCSCNKAEEECNTDCGCGDNCKNRTNQASKKTKKNEEES
eukprot:TRINITY_DN8981_c0_g1_i1.p1 TRINITY_DN8981_c0_g1~~TRINITY_DN8981_c0_g1_i1.p1  ORF type:complete len:769 (+),score=99.52 TRINITY_DN8981_c0_g1_i1:67-2373(+)